MSNTPRTDALVERHGVWSPARLLSAYEQLAVHARTLERELMRAEATIEGVRAELKTVRDGFAREFAANCKLQHDFDEMQLRAVRAESDKRGPTA